MNVLKHEVKKNSKNDQSKIFKALKSGILSLLVLGLTVTSCSSSDEATETENQLEDTLEVQRSAQIDQVDNVLGDLIIEVYETEESGTSDRNG